MFLEIKEYEMVNLNDIASFAIYPNDSGDYTPRTLFIKQRGVKDCMTFRFETVAECKRAYRKLINALRKNGSIVKELDDDMLEE